MFYTNNSDKEINPQLFKNPTSEYRGTPFWAWNTDLNQDELERQIEILKKMGLGGFHMHVRTGMSTKYLSDEFMSLISGCVDKAKSEDMLAWLYDEDRWPSGAAGGYVTKDNKFRARNLLMTTKPCTDDENVDKVMGSRTSGGRVGESKFLACYDVTLDEQGYLKSYRLIDENTIASGTKWYAYRKICTSSAWYNNQAYLDTMNKEAVEEFIKVTHERYKQVVGEEFGKAIPAIFTDEPQFDPKNCLKDSTETRDITMPWTDDFPDTYKETYGENLLEFLPEIFWEKGEDEYSHVRYRFHDHLAERFAKGFNDTIGKWCEENGIALTGHMMNEPRLQCQSKSVGECMRQYRSYQIPGIDMLCRNFEFTTAKQCQSAVHQYGREAMLSELYGVTGWSTDFRDYKILGDWQAAMGVTVRVPHLAWVAMGGEAKRDYPASMSYQSTWWEKYNIVEDHFARVNTLLSRGKPVIKIGVIHPIESYWLKFGPEDKTGKIRALQDKHFLELADWLVTGGFDFNYISEALLPSQCEIASNPLKVGKMDYNVIIVPNLDTIRSSTLLILNKFKDNGGRLIFLGKAPSLVDAKFSNDAKKLYLKSESYQFEKVVLYDALESERLVKFTDSKGKVTDKFVSQLRNDGDKLIAFICPSRLSDRVNENSPNKYKFIFCGEYNVEHYNTQTGEIEQIPFEYEGKNTVIVRDMYDFDSLLLVLSPGKCEPVKEKETVNCSDLVLPSKFEYSLSEPNVLLLDIAEYKLDNDSNWNNAEEILRIDQIARKSYGLPCNGGQIAQPWVVSPEEPADFVRLRFTFESEIEVKGALLALENPEKSEIIFNGCEISTEIVGYFTDKDIKTINLPVIIKGKNILEVKQPIGERAFIEWLYILGDFGVKIFKGEEETKYLLDKKGEEYTEFYRVDSKVLTSLPETLSLGSITEQGLPFFSGNITYKFNVDSDNFKLKLNKINGTLAEIKIDGTFIGDIVYPPYEMNCINLGKGVHSIEIKLYTNRANSFGAIHRVGDRQEEGPDAWRTKGNDWTYGYNLRNIGIE